MGTRAVTSHDHTRLPKGPNVAVVDPLPIDVSIVLPCLNEAEALPTAIASAQAALVELHRRAGLSGEILVADNGSTDASRGIAAELGACVVEVAERGYGAALMGGFRAARGRYLVMGDADGSYDFRDAVAMVEALRDGADLCMGSRFRGGIARGAMPWKNRYLGNPILTGLLNVLFQTRVSDAHCGLRALTKGCLKQLNLRGNGMEFASEMVVKAALKKLMIAEVPATLSPDRRGRSPHLRPWRDGWRHLRFLLMLSPTWLFLVPAGILMAGALAIFGIAVVTTLLGDTAAGPVGSNWLILAGAMLGLGHNAGLLAAVAHLFGRREGYRLPGRHTAALARWISLESMLALGAISFLAGLAVLFAVLGYWSLNHFGPLDSVLPAVFGTSLMVLGAQTSLSGFLLSVIGGHEAAFLAPSGRPVRRMPGELSGDAFPEGPRTASPPRQQRPAA